MMEVIDQARDITREAASPISSLGWPVCNHRRTSAVLLQGAESHYPHLGSWDQIIKSVDDFVNSSQVSYLGWASLEAQMEKNLPAV